jgi:dienelactone hydrolase
MAGTGCKDCVSGALHGGNPAGVVTNLHGLQTYIASPLEGVGPKGVVVIIPDAFGWSLTNSRILADNYARKGQFLVYLPDFMNGES